MVFINVVSLCHGLKEDVVMGLYSFRTVDIPFCSLSRPFLSPFEGFEARDFLAPEACSKVNTLSEVFVPADRLGAWADFQFNIPLCTFKANVLAE